MTWVNEYEDIYEIMNLLEDAVRRRNADAVVDGIESWLIEPDQDKAEFAEALAQGVQDAITHAMSINEGKTTITIMEPGEAMIRFEQHDEEEPSKAFNGAVISAVKRVLKKHRHI
jgi:hypothetical protein